MRRVAVIAAALTFACGRVDDAATDASRTETGVVDAGLCSPTVAEDCGDASQRHYYRVDLNRRCIDHASGPVIEMCGCTRLSPSCWIETATGAVFTSPCSANLLPGYCRCDEDLDRELTNLPSCE